jgi:hypothetical protein
MSITAAIAAVESLRPEQKVFLKDLKTRASMPAGRWSESLTQIVEVGRVTLPASRLCLKLGCAGMVMVVASTVLAFKWPLLGVPALVVSLVIVGWAQWHGSRLRGAGKAEFLARIEKFLLPCVRIFQRDMDEQQPLRLEADLRFGPGDQIGPPRQLPGPFTNRSVHKVVEKSYRKPLVAGQARLADGSLLSWRVTDYLRLREITKRGASGKTKQKIKTRGRRQITARLGLRADAWTLAAAPEAGQGGTGITATQNERRLVLKVRRNIDLGKAPGLAKGTPPDRLEDLLETIGSLYAQATPRGPSAAAPGRQS